MMKFTEAQLESAIIELLGVEGYPHVLIKADRRAFLANQYVVDYRPFTLLNVIH
jgi:hypothetical protein